MHVAIDALVLCRRSSGVHYCVSDLIRALGSLEDGVRYTVLAPPGVGAEQLARGNVTVRIVSCFLKIKTARIIWEQTVLTREAREIGADVLHSPAYICPILPGMPVVLTVYDTIALSHPDLSARSTSLYFGAMLPKAAAAASAIICPSEWTRDRLAELPGVKRERIRVIPPGISPIFLPESGEARAAVRRRYGLPDSYLLFVGNVEPKKNLRILAEVLAGPEGKKLPALVVVGRRAWKAGTTLKRLRHTALAGRVHFTGYVPRRDLPAIYSGAAAFVFPSIVEGFGLPILEAMACATPVIASRNAALPETAGGAAVLVDPTDSAEIAGALSSLLDEPERWSTMAARGTERARTFPWRVSAEKTVQVYRDVWKSQRSS